MAEPVGELKRQLGLFDGINVVIGCIIGSGIFIVPAITASLVRSPAMVLLVWIAGGVLTFCGALAYAELGAALPHAGGQYVYLREAYGPLPAFLYGWTLFLVIQSGGIAALAAAFSIYAGYFLPLGTTAARLLSAGIVLLLAAVNCIGVRPGAAVQNLLTVIKIGGVAAVALVAFASARGSTGQMAPFWPASLPPLTAIGAAMVGVLWAYEGWHNFSFVVGETRRPERNVPWALILGTGICIGLYLAATLAYMYVLPFAALGASTRVAADAMQTAVGGLGGTMISLLILLSVTGAANGMTLSGPRAYYAMACDGLFFRPLQRVHPVHGTPAAAIIVQAAWAGLLALSGRYDQLFTYVIFASWLFYGLTVAGVIVLRKKHPEWPRPYRAWGYPVVPALFSLAAFAIVAGTLASRPRESLFGIIIVLLGLPAYFWWKRGAVRLQREPSSTEAKAAGPTS